MQRPNAAALASKLIAFSTLFLLASSAWAHHATATEYDISKTVTLKGTITRVDWANPHIHVYMEIKPERGAAQQWDVEFPSPGAAIVAGLSRETLASGVVLTFKGYVSRPDFHPTPRKNSNPEGHLALQQNFGCATAITLSNGDRFTFLVGI